MLLLLLLLLKAENTDVDIGTMPDLPHPSPDGYRRWAAVLAPVVAELLR